MMNRARWTSTVCLLLALFVVSAPAAAGEYYQHDNAQYWWYLDSDPAFEVAVPANAYRYVEREMFGEKLVEIYLGPNGPILTIGTVAAGRDRVPAIRQALLGRWGYLFTNPTVLDNRQLTTTNQVAADFYAQTAATPAGNRAMFRGIFFHRNGQIVYLTYVLNERDFADFPRAAWFEAVNSFGWR